MTPAFRLFLPLVAIALLAACSEQGANELQKIDGDPALTSALADQIMVDPHLVGQDQSNAIITVTGPPSAGIPTQETGLAASQTARAEAAKLVGGIIRTAPDPAKPDPAKGESAVSLGDAVTAPQLARAALAGAKSCAGKLEYTAAWAARVPETFPVYPRGAVQEAAGTDRDGCALRVVSFTTPVSLGDVMDFYFTRASAAGYGVRHSLEGEHHALAGTKGAARYLVHAHARGDGLTEVELITSGG